MGDRQLALCSLLRGIKYIFEFISYIFLKKNNLSSLWIKSSKTQVAARPPNLLRSQIELDLPCKE